MISPGRFFNIVTWLGDHLAQTWFGLITLESSVRIVVGKGQKGLTIVVSPSSEISGTKFSVV